MKNQSKLISELVINLFIIFLCLYFWRFIFIPYENVDILGDYSSQFYHSQNDFLRYSFFILFSTANFFFLKKILSNDSYLTFFENIKKNNTELKSNLILKVSLLIILSILFIQFFSTPFVVFLDVYHDGQKMSSAFKSSIDGSLWSGSYVTVGIFYETLMTKLSWKLLNSYSIGSSKFAIITLIFTSKLLLCFLAYQISNYSNLNKQNQVVYFIILSFIFLSLSNYNLGAVDLLTYRDIPILILIIFFPYIEKNNLYSLLILFFLGLISFPTFFWGIDRGIIYNILLLILLIYLILKLQTKLYIFLFASTLFSYLFFINFLGEEFPYFLNNTINILKEINYIHGIIHPIPITDEDNSARATKSLILIIFSLLITLNMFFKNDKKYFLLKKIFLIISFCCVLSYINALGRSDGPHIRSTFGFPIIFFVSYLLFNIICFFEKKLPNHYYKKTIHFSILIFLFIVGIFHMNIKFNNILNFKERFTLFINLEDEKFLNENYKNYVLDIKEIIKKEQCIQLFTYSAIMPYLLKKKNCSKFYFVWSLGSQNIQKEMIKEIKNVNFILSDKKENFQKLSPNYKLPLVKEFIDNNYYIFKSYQEFDLLKKNE